MKIKNLIKSALLIAMLLSAFVLTESAAHAAAPATPLPFPTFGALPVSGGTPTSPPVPTATPQPGVTLPPAPTSPAGGPITLPTLRSDVMGIQIQPDLTEVQWKQMNDFVASLGMRWIKLQISWRELQPQQGQWSQLDAILPGYIQYAQGRAGNGVRVLLSVAKAPDWARPAGFSGDGPPRDPALLAAFVGEVVTRYKLRNEDAIEIWNEPNLTADWNNVPLNAATYMRYFDAAYKAIRAKSGVQIITAGLAPTGDGPGSVEDRRYLQEMYNAGLKNYPDVAVGIHPYGWANAPDARCCQNSPDGWKDRPAFYFLETIDAYRQIMVRNGQSSNKLWATEFGWSTFDNLREKDHVNGPLAKAPSDPGVGWARQLNEAQRTQYTLRAFDIAQNGDYAAFMGPMMLWNLNFADLPGYVRSDTDSRLEAGFSILNGDGFPRALYDAISQAPKR